jgi:DNA-directed RNA polymerase specialized sigma24 family protein
MSPLSLRRYRAERLLAKEFTGLRSKVLSVVRFKLRGHTVRLNTADLEACYAQAWQGLYAALLEGEQIDNAGAWLVVATLRRALDESDSLTRHPVADVVEAQSVEFDPDIAAALDARARLHHLFEGLRSRLSERECRVASLCYLQGLSRAEAAAQMGISEARMRKLMDGASPSRPGVAGKVGELLGTIAADGWCEQQSSLMRAFAFGVLDPGGERHALALSHCRECPACRAHVASLRGLAAVLPPLPIPLALAGGLAAGAHARASIAARGSAVPAPASAGGAWSGLGGSFALKLALGGLIVLGGGYAVAGGVSHESPHRPPSAPPLSIASGSRRVSLAARSRHARPRARPSPRRAHPAHAARRPGSTGSATREFGPERVSLAASLPAASTTPAGRRRAGGAAREFGFE